jgi:hypothetical protein
MAENNRLSFRSFYKIKSDKQEIWKKTSNNELKTIQKWAIFSRILKNENEMTRLLPSLCEANFSTFC